MDFTWAFALAASDFLLAKSSDCRFNSSKSSTNISFSDSILFSYDLALTFSFELTLLCFASAMNPFVPLAAKMIVKINIKLETHF